MMVNFLSTADNCEADIEEISTENSKTKQSTAKQGFGSGQVLILDGGNGHALRRNGVLIKGVIGTMERFLNVALANRDQPQIVIKTHLQYLRAGANVITTNNYSCVPAAIELSPDNSPELVIDLIERAGRLAQQACDTFLAESPAGTARPLVAGGLPPLHESYRADRVEQIHQKFQSSLHNPIFGPWKFDFEFWKQVSDNDRELIEGYAMIAKHITPFCDVLLCETMSSVREGKFAAEAANCMGKPVWIAWTLADETHGTLRSGETVEEAVAAVAHCKNIEAMLFNCCSHEAILAALPRLRAAAPPGMALGAYANGFAKTMRPLVYLQTVVRKQSVEYEDISGHQYATQAREWMDTAGVTIIGCCGIFAEHIQVVAKELKPSLPAACMAFCVELTCVLAHLLSAALILVPSLRDSVAYVDMISSKYLCVILSFDILALILVHNSKFFANFRNNVYLTYVVLTVAMEWGFVPSIAAGGWGLGFGGWLYYSVTVLSLQCISKIRHYSFYTRAAFLSYLTEGIVKLETREGRDESADDVILMNEFENIDEPVKLGLRKRLVAGVKNVFTKKKSADMSPGTGRSASTAATDEGDVLPIVPKEESFANASFGSC